jgi:hypothetical protein
MDNLSSLLHARTGKSHRKFFKDMGWNTQEYLFGIQQCCDTFFHEKSGIVYGRILFDVRMGKGSSFAHRAIKKKRFPVIAGRG